MGDVRCSVDREGARVVLALRSTGGGVTLEGPAAAVAALSASLAAAVAADEDASLCLQITGNLTLCAAPAARRPELVK